MHPRYAPVVPAAPLPRDSIEPVHHIQIDLSLKSLRTVARRLVVFSAPYSEELQILERIYYKGKNQHRSAVFWRNVVETRRIGARIIEMDMPGLVEGLRCSFYIAEASTNLKILHGAWKHVPGVNFCKSSLERLRSACLLIDRARAQIRVAHRGFTRLLRTATFLPLAVSLLAISSRLDFLLVELRNIVALLWEAIIQILETIDSAPISKTDRGFLPPQDPYGLTLSPAKVRSDATGPERPRKKAKLSTVKEKAEDLGSRLIRDPEPQSATFTTPCTTMNVEPAPLPDSSAFAIHFGQDFAGSTSVRQFRPSLIPPPSGHCSRHDVQDIRTPGIIQSQPHSPPSTFCAVQLPISAIPTEDERSTSKALEQRRGRTTEKKMRKAVKAKAKMKKRDEIDDIFGF